MSQSLGWLLAVACGVFFASTGCSPVQLVERGDLVGLQRRLDKGADPNEADGRGVTALGQAIRDGNKEAVKILLTSGADANAMSMTRDGPRSPIGVAFETLKPRFYSVEAGAPIESGTDFPEVVAMLLDAGANIDGTTPQHTPLGLAVACAASGRGDEQAVRRAARCEAVAVALLARGAEPNKKGDNGLTPLELLIQTMDEIPEAVHWSRVLLLHGAKTELDGTLAAVVDAVGQGAFIKRSQMVRRSFFGQIHPDDLKIAAIHEARVRRSMGAVSLSLALGADPNGPPGGGYSEFRNGSTIVEAVAHALAAKEWPETQELLDMLLKAGGVITPAAAADLDMLRKNRQARRDQQIMRFIKGATAALTVTTLLRMAADGSETSVDPPAPEPPPPPTKDRRNRSRGKTPPPPRSVMPATQATREPAERCPDGFPSGQEIARVRDDTYKVRCRNGRPAFVYLLKKEGKWVGESNRAPLVFDRTGVRSTPEAAGRWECGCHD